MAKNLPSKSPQPPEQSSGVYDGNMLPNTLSTSDLNADDTRMVGIINRRIREMLSNRNQHELAWDRNTRNFLMEDQPDKEDWQAKGQSSLLFGVVQGILSEILASEPIAQMVPFTDDVNTLLTEKLDKLVHIPLRERENFLNFALVLLEAITNGTGIAKVGYACEEREYKFLVDAGVNKDGTPKRKYESQVVTVKDEIPLRRVAINRFLFDPYATSIEDSNDCIEMVWYSYEDFLQKYQDQDFYFDVDKVQPINRTSTTPSYGAGSTEPLLQRFLIPGQKQYVRVIEYWSRTPDIFAVIANGRLIRNTPNPYNDKRLPYVNFRFGLVNDRLYGLGVAEVMKSAQEHLSANQRIGLDQSKLASTPSIIANTTLGIDDDQLGVQKPGGIISVDGDVGQTKVMPVADISNSLKYMSDTMHEEAKMASGFDTRMNQQNSPATAFEYGLRQESQMKRIAMVVRLMEIDGMAPLLERVWSRMQQFYTSSKIYRGYDTKNRVPVKVEGYPTFMYQEGTGDWRALAITRELATEMQKDYRVAIRAGWQIGQSKIMQRAAAQEELQVFAKFLTDPTIMPGQVGQDGKPVDPRIVGLKPLVKEVMQKMGFDYAKVQPEGEFTPPPPPQPEDPTKMNLNLRGDLAKMPPQVQEKAMEKVLGTSLAPEGFEQGAPAGADPMGGQPPMEGAMPMSVPDLPQHAQSQAPNYSPTAGAPNPGAQI